MRTRFGRPIAALLVLLLAAAPAAWAVPCDAAGETCCCPSTAPGECETFTGASCGCVIEDGDARHPATPVTATDGPRGPSAAPAATLCVTSAPSCAGPAAELSASSATLTSSRLYLRHAVFRC